MKKYFLKHGIWLLGLFLSACSPHIQPTQSNIQKPVLFTDHFEAADGIKLPVKSWAPSSAPKTIIIALHGFNDYNNSFQLPGKYFSEKSIALYAFDQRGFGGTPFSGIWAGKDRLVEDTKEMIEIIHQKYPNATIYLLGESMGGAIAIETLAQENVDVDGIILVSPALWSDTFLNGFYYTILWAVAHTFPEERFTGKNLKILATDNIQLLREMGKDPLVQKSARADALYGLVQLMSSAYHEISSIRVPLLLLYGNKDQVIREEPIRSAVKRMHSNCTAIYYPEGYHMLLRDIRRERVAFDIFNWINTDKSTNAIAKQHLKDECQTYVRPF